MHKNDQWIETHCFPVIDHEFRHNIVGDPRGDSRVDPQTTQPRSQGPLSTSRKYPGYNWSRVC